MFCVRPHRHTERDWPPTSAFESPCRPADSGVGTRGWVKRFLGISLQAVKHSPSGHGVPDGAQLSSGLWQSNPVLLVASRCWEKGARACTVAAWSFKSGARPERARTPFWREGEMHRDEAEARQWDWREGG